MNKKALISHEDPKSNISEAYKMLRTNLHFSDIDTAIKTIMVTSSNMGEGKTTTATNLAITLAQSDHKTLYIGADLRKPKGYKVFQVPNSVGLTSIITKKAPVDAAIVDIKEVEHLSVLPSGPIPPNPSEILLSNSMKNLIKELEDIYDYIIIDVPPVNSVTDASIVATIVDGVLLVVASNQTSKDSSKIAIKSLEKVKAHILGAVLTKVKKSSGHYYYYEYYSEDNSGKKGLFNKKKNKKKRRNNDTEAVTKTS